MCAHFVLIGNIGTQGQTIYKGMRKNQIFSFTPIR